MDPIVNRKEYDMTLPDERYKALKLGKKLLEELCDPGKTPRVPGSVRDRARAALRHYPNDYEFDRIADNSPELLDKIPFGTKFIKKETHGTTI
jgi:hypothetical protein